jgi:hypothetical protein
LATRRTLGVDRLAEHDAVDPVDLAVELRTSDLQRQLALVLAVDVQEIEGDELSSVRAREWSEARRNHGGRPVGAQRPGDRA